MDDQAVGYGFNVRQNRGIEIKELSVSDQRIVFEMHFIGKLPPYIGNRNGLIPSDPVVVTVICIRIPDRIVGNLDHENRVRTEPHQIACTQRPHRV